MFLFPSIIPPNLYKYNRFPNTTLKLYLESSRSRGSAKVKIVEKKWVPLLRIFCVRTIGTLAVLRQLIYLGLPEMVWPLFVTTAEDNRLH